MLDGLDAVLLARVQFGFTIAYHIVFPAFTIGIASYLAVLEGLWLLTNRNVYFDLFRFWVRIFAVVFGMGVVSGIVMSYQFGTNWSGFSDRAGPVIGPLMGYEVLTAFFLEAGFLGIMLFGMERVGRALHFTATVMVAAGTALSAFWILAANSWMQTPAGYSVNAAGQFVPEHWLAVIFNPSFPYRFVHMVIAAYLTTAFAVAAVGAFHLLRDPDNRMARVMFSMAMWMAALVTPLQLIAGDGHGLNSIEHQPAKVAAIEGLFETVDGAPLVLFGWPDMDEAKILYAIEIPKAGSLILTHSLDGRVRGLKEWPRPDWPHVPTVFWSFRTMVGIGLLMLAVGITSLVLRVRGRLYEARWFHRIAVATGPIGFIAVIAGWIVTEAGRQPWIVQGLLRTADAASPVAAPAVATSLIAFIIVYFTVFGAGIFYVLRLINRMRAPGPDLDRGPIRATSPQASVPANEGRRP